MPPPSILYYAKLPFNALLCGRMKKPGIKALCGGIYLLFLFQPSMAGAQVLDSIFPSTEKSRYLYAWQLYNLDSTTVEEDTVHENGHRIHPLVASETGFMDCGLPGTPAYTFRLTESPAMGFNAGVSAMDALFFHTDSIKLYRSPAPRTFLKYGQGTGELIYLEAEHSQNIFERWNFGMSYRRIKVQNWYYDNIEGLTLARIPNNYNLSTYSRYHTANRKYEVVASYIWNKATIAETGGMVNTEKFDTLDRREKQYFNSVYLPGATNEFKESEISATQFFRFGSSKIVINENKDTAGIMDTLKHFTPKGHLYHRVQYHKQAYRFTDENPEMTYYPVRLIGLATNDSFVINRLTNTAGIMLLPFEKAPRLDISVDHDWIRTNQSKYMESNFQQVWVNAKVTQPVKRQLLVLTGRYGVTGYNAGDIHLNAGIKLQAGDSIHPLKIRGNARFSRYQPSYLQNYFVSNHFYWYGRFEPASYVMAGGGISYRHYIGLEGAIETFDRPVVFGVDARPLQAGTVSVLSARLRNRTDLWRFHLQSEILLKVVPDDSPIRYPLVTAKESFYYEGYFFKGNMLTRIGIDLYYYSAFNAPYYNPATRQYQLQNEMEIGNYPMFDVFFTGKVRTVDLFFVYRHANAGYFGDAYYASPRYPQITSSARLGLSWRLFN